MQKNLTPFKLERFFARYEFKARYLLSSSDCESLRMEDLLRMASPESRALWDGLRLGYSESPGHPLLREQIAGLYENVSPEGVVTAAPEEAIFILMNTLLNPGDEVIVTMPAYQSLYEVPRWLGCRVIPWQVELGAQGWQVDVQKLAGSLSPRTKLIALNFPHNPTGHLISLAEQEAIIELARQRGISIFSDEMYRLLEPEPALRLPALCDRYEGGISLSGLSKAYGLPGLRSGWLATQDPALPEQWLRFKDYTTICSSAPSEILSIIALQNQETILRRNLQMVLANTATAQAFFARHAGQLAWTPPKAGSVALARWLGEGTVEEFCQGLLDACGVMLVPGSLFDLPGDFFRLGLGRANFSEALGEVEGYLGANNRE
jgi:aspartate/methionine/tyrosine aminotransferase